MPTETRSLRALLAHSIDYAGLFPPAALDMATAVRNYHEYHCSADAWLLGRFVVPVARLEEFADAAGEYLPRDGDREPWRIAALVGADSAGEAERALSFNCTHRSGSEAGHAVIDVAELKAVAPQEITAAAGRLPRSLGCFFEIPLEDPVPFARAAAGAGVGLKARTGGITADAFPAAGEVAAFILAATAAGVRYKVTAGLHHLVRGEYRLTYEPGSACGSMFGFLNVFVAAAAAAAGHPAGQVERLLTEDDPSSIRFTDDALHWDDLVVNSGGIARSRELLTAFGSCSFLEPVAELRAAGLIA
jgi:hypothetical protein